MPAVCGREASPGPLGSLAPALPLRRDSRPDLIHSTSTAEHVLGAEPGSRNGDAAESNTGALPANDAPCEGRMIKPGREGGRENPNSRNSTLALRQRSIPRNGPGNRGDQSQVKSVPSCPPSLPCESARSHILTPRASNITVTHGQMAT